MEHNSPRRKGSRRRLWVWASVATILVCATSALALTKIHNISSAPQGDRPECTKVASLAPGKVSDKTRDWTLGNGVAAWGNASAVLRCGVSELPPTTNLCIAAEGIDWVLDEERLEREGVSALRTYGRAPAIEFTYYGPREDVGGILVELKSAIDWIPQNSKCT
ncbi:DUF3515 family protein [Streptomyces fragilis]|uniref:DUF3515 family protein n=1 Tax=Streptomyces fragilis TaxID=67301 RepID=A0ABV2YCK9_9ACTN|nr:DUF3515 family protein [Streptomyces fragilis]